MKHLKTAFEYIKNNKTRFAVEFLISLCVVSAVRGDMNTANLSMLLAALLLAMGAIKSMFQK